MEFSGKIVSLKVALASKHSVLRQHINDYVYEVKQSMNYKNIVLSTSSEWININFLFSLYTIYNSHRTF